jgi:hypothetical protein
MKQSTSVLAATVAFLVTSLVATLSLLAVSANPAAAYPLGPGYTLVGAQGGAYTFGQSQFFGSLGDTTLAQPIVGAAEDPFLEGYWMVGQDGGVFAFGSSGYYGSLPAQGIHVDDVVGMASTPPGLGYWIASSNGGVFSYGDAHFFGSAGGLKLNSPIVGIAATPDGGGYWLVAADGGVFSYGDAQFFGSTGGTHLNAPIVGIASTPDGGGYWLVASDGGVFSYGDAQFYGSTGGTHLNAPVVGIATTQDGHGYWLVGSDGGIFSYGDAGYAGSLPGQGITLKKPVVAVLSRPPLAVKVDAYAPSGTETSDWAQVSPGSWQLQLAGGSASTPAGARVLGVEGLTVAQLQTLGFTVAGGTCDGTQPYFLLEAKNAAGGIDQGTFPCTGSSGSTFTVDPTSGPDALPASDVVTSLDIVEPSGSSALTNIQVAGLTITDFDTFTAAGTVIG